MPASEKDPTFGGVLRRLRHEKRLTLEQLARAADMSIPYLSQVERGKLPPPSDRKIRLLEEELGAYGELVPLSGRVPRDLLKTVKRYPVEYSRLLRYAKQLNHEGLKRLLALVEGSGLVKKVTRSRDSKATPKPDDE